MSLIPFQTRSYSSVEFTGTIPMTQLNGNQLKFDGILDPETIPVSRRWALKAQYDDLYQRLLKILKTHGDKPELVQATIQCGLAAGLTQEKISDDMC